MDDVYYDIAYEISKYVYDGDKHSFYALYFVNKNWHEFFLKTKKSYPYLFRVSPTTRMACKLVYYQESKIEMLNRLYSFFSELFVDYEGTQVSDMRWYVQRTIENIKGFMYRPVSMTKENFNNTHPYSYQQLTNDSPRLFPFLRTKMWIYISHQFVSYLHALKKYEKSIRFRFYPIINLKTSYLYSLLLLFEWLYIKTFKCVHEDK